MMRFSSVQNMYHDMQALLMEGDGDVPNYMAVIERMTPEAYTFETPLFPLLALEAYSRHNLQVPLALNHAEQFSSLRGGPQGDYAEGMTAKIERVALALNGKRQSKRAVLTVPFTDKCSLCVKTEDDAEWKCLREVYFRVDKLGFLHATGVMRAQALIIVPKNLYMIGQLMESVARQTNTTVGSYTHICVRLVEDRA